MGEESSDSSSLEATSSPMSSEQVWSSFQFSKEQWRTQSKSSDSSSETKQNVSKKSTGCPQNMGREKPSRHEPSGGGTYKHQTTVLSDSSSRFMQNFDPQNSSRNQQKKKKRYHHNDGRLIQLAEDFDGCDCLRPNCSGCHLPCPSCKGTRCGHECRVNRRWLYDSVEVEGQNLEFKNPHVSSFT